MLGLEPDLRLKPIRLWARSGCAEAMRELGGDASHRLKIEIGAFGIIGAIGIDERRPDAGRRCDGLEIDAVAWFVSDDAYRVKPRYPGVQRLQLAGRKRVDLEPDRPYPGQVVAGLEILK